MSELPPPSGFVHVEGRGPFTTHNGPYFHRPTAAGAEQAFFALDRHCNGLGLIHGGMLAAFLDGLLAAAVARAKEVAPVTMHLSIDFLDMGRAGEWVVGEARVLRATSDVAFAEGRVHIRGRDLARASGLFKLMRRRAG
ncbi:MAG TPA: PaaI family thioesterase [Caulobacteraceae bacterium]